MEGQVPLADQLRPASLQDFIGQEHLVGQDKPLYLAIKKDQVFSMIFWGPPGCGKTTLARIIANQTERRFFHLSAVSAKKDDLREIVQSIENGLYPQGSVVFLDEIHRFNKAQQDYLLPFVEKGTITLIGATTENPSFEVIDPLLSRCRVFTLKPLSKKELAELVNRGLKWFKKKRQLKVLKIAEKAEEFLLDFSNGDARVVLNGLELAVNLVMAKPGQDKAKLEISLKDLEAVFQKKALGYDKQGEEHYNTISAFIKSMRAGDVDAALYYLARMVEAGEDPLFIARRMVIFASEDVGMALPTALVVANEVFQACEAIGYPECAINLAHGTVYLASAPKDRSSYEALRKAQGDVNQHGNLPIPMSLRNPETKLMKELGYGKGYEKYPDEDKSLLPEELKGKRYYEKK